jgi:Carboxypeptidase regulatory-like domain
LSPRGFSSKSGSCLAAVVAVVLVALALPAFASAADGGISGEVTRQSGGAAAAGAEVCAEEQEGEFAFECTLTEFDGSYEISSLPPGKYIVSFYAGESGLWLVSQYYNGVRSRSAATEVTVASGLTTPGIDAALAAGGAIAGRVTAAKTGAAVSEVLVCSWTEAGEEFDGCSETASDGSYEIVGVAPGLHELEFWSWEQFGTEFRNGVLVSAGARTSGVSVALQAGSISGHVYAAATHQPLSKVPVCGIWAESGEVGGCVLTNSSGAYGFYPVAAGSLKIVFSPDPAEVEFAKGVSSDIWPTQFWSSKPTLAQADALEVAPTSVFADIDGLLGPGPAAPSSNPPASSTPAPAPIAKPLACKKGFVEKRVKGESRCVRKRHHHKHHRRHRHH